MNDRRLTAKAIYTPGRFPMGGMPVILRVTKEAGA
jgi:hypothetical protein